MSELCQIPEPLAIAITGPAGSGKSTLGRALAEALRVPLLDQDRITNPLLDAIPDEVLGGHWLTGQLASSIRDGRYAALRAVAEDVIATAGSCVLVAPFTMELQGGAEWDALVAAVAPARLTVLNLVGELEMFAERRAARGEARDAYRPADTSTTVPVVPTIPVDADLDTAQQVARILPALGVRTTVDPGNALFSRTFDAVLFDLDGTLVDSTASVIRSWRRFADHFAVPMDALHENHGQPARVLIGRVLPADRFDEAFAHITDLEVGDAAGLRPVLGAKELIETLPPERKAIVTSGSVPIATARLAAAGIDRPEVMVTVEDVTRGKPDPEPFLTAAARLGVDPARCLVVEDAAAGIAAATAAGCQVLAVAGTSPAEELAQAALIVDGLDVVRLQVTDDGVRLALAARMSAAALSPA